MKPIYYSLIITLFILPQAAWCTLTDETKPDSTGYYVYQNGLSKVNQCTPWHHVKCVMITGGEVYEDGRDGKKVRHWWKMSYIGTACKERYGKVFGTLFEGFFAIPHYTGVAVGSGFGYMVFLVRGPRDQEKVANRQKKRAERKKRRKLKGSPLL